MFDFRDFLLQFLVRGVVVTTAVHEYGHLLALRLLGFSGEIRSGALNAVYPVFGRPLAWWEHAAVYGGGGFFQAAVFLVLGWLDEDDENRLISLMIAWQGAVYGCFEALAPRVFWDFGAFLGAMAACFLFLAYAQRNIVFQKKG